jgi:hypothetical protein
MNNKINLSKFIGKINAYQLSFMPRSITGRLVEQNGDFLRIELRDGNIIVATYRSIGVDLAHGSEAGGGIGIMWRIAHIAHMEHQNK